MVKTRVLLVDDDALVRAGLRMILTSSEELEVVGEAADGADAVAAAMAHRPDVVLMDIRMPGMDGIAATSALRRFATPPHVIVLTTFQADEHVMSALRAGADGFLLKDTAPAEIVRAVRLVAAGEAMLSPSVTRTLLSQLGNDEMTIEYAADDGGSGARSPRGASIGMLQRLCERIGWALRERPDDAATPWIYRVVFAGSAAA